MAVVCPLTPPIRCRFVFYLLLVLFGFWFFDTNRLLLQFYWWSFDFRLGVLTAFLFQ